ncbi:MAG TPA: Gfo/Idh/MocA family oxidoreductase, partial [Chloroflexota bacterium]
MNILILGLSSIVQRRVLPGLHALGVERVDVATRKAVDPAVRRGWTHGHIFESYQAALSESDASVVYVSLVNSEHEHWIEASLRAGRHVIVDKPAALGCDVTERLLDLADRQARCLAEAIVFGYHPQVQVIRQVFAESASAPTQIAAFFSFPPLDPANFRYHRALGGGALWDVGPYAAAAGRIFFGAEPQTVSCEVLQTHGAEDLEIAFSALCTFSEGRSLFGHFGFDTVYRNRLDLVSPNVGVQVDRIFTTAP